VRPEKSKKGQRVYSRRDIDTLLKVKDLLYSHQYTIAGAKQRLRQGGVEPFETSDPSARELAELRVNLESMRDDIHGAIEAIAQL
ncbi:MerR family transcriptional regulator, partial [Endomicrobium sp. AH-315-J14]|nr:MerR family transcriptional regulator [Endomicrobium sp. AH-315-J14]